MSLSSYCQEILPFRFFTSQDGLKESWVSSLSVGPTGTVWINHGEVDEMIRYDGFQFQRIPSPGPDVRVVEDRSRQVWTLKLRPVRGFRKLVDGRWIDFDIPNEYRDWQFSQRVPFIPLGHDRILYLLPGALLEFNAENRTARLIKNASDTGLKRFIDMTQWRDESIWILGEKGVARIDRIRTEPERLDESGWFERSIPGDLSVANLGEPLICRNQEIFTVGSDLSSEQKVLIRFDGEKWERPSAPVSENILAGWRGGDGNLWIVSGTSNKWKLLRLVGDQADPIPQNRILSGLINDVLVEPDGIFWIATSTGLVRYTPFLWQTPDETADLKEKFHGVAQDREGRLWFSYQDLLLSYHRGQWKRFPFPQEIKKLHFEMNNILGVLPDGNLAILLAMGRLLIFHPSEERFEIKIHPANRYIGMVSTENDGNALISSQDASGALWLESFDGQKFVRIFESAQLAEIGQVRGILRAGNGDIWLAGLKGVGRVLNGNFQHFTEADGYTGAGAFAIAELSDGRIWFGGRDKIVEYNGDAWREVRSTGLESVRGILQRQNGDVWAASGSGLHRFHDGYWITNNCYDGLPDASATSVFEDDSGRLWAGTLLGLRLYHPENDASPPESFIPLQHNLMEMPPGGEVRLLFEGSDRWRQTAAGRLLYSYSLDNMDWSPFRPDTVFTVEHLPSGSHAFAVRAMDRSGNIDPTPAEFLFTVLLPWYKTPGFLVVASLGAIVILLLLAFAVSRYIWMEKLVEQRTVELARRETVYRTLVESLQQNIFLKDREGVFLSANSSFCNLIGLPLDQIVGRTDFDFYPSDLAEKYQQDDRSILQTKDAFHAIEENVIRGERKWVEVFKTPIRDEQGTISGILGIFWDITERMQQQEALRKNQELLESTQKIAHVGSWRSDLVAKELTWSAEAYRIFAIDPSQFDGKIETFYSLVHPDDVERVRETSRQATRNRIPYQIDHRIILPDGAIRWVFERAEVVVDLAGAPIQLVGTIQDITEQRMAEESIRNLAKFPNENPHPVLRVSREGVLLFANKPSKPLLDFWGIQTGQPVPKDLNSTLQERYASCEKQEIEIVCGKQIFLLLVVPIPDSGYINIYGIDVTEKKRLEEQFRQAQKMEAIGQLAGGVAHDFNNLIMAIQGYSQFLLNDLPSESHLRKDVDEIIKAAQRAASLTRQLLAFSRKQVLQPVILNLNHLIPEMDKMLRRLIGENIELVANLHPGLGMIKADPGQIEQIIMNLVVNARDAMPKGGRLTLETANVQLDGRYTREYDYIEAGSYVMLAVSDTGCGIDKETLQRIFDPFFTTKELGKGTGLGLSTVYGIVKQSGGSIWVYSETGKGTVFKIYFPRMETEGAISLEIPALLSTRPGTETILLVEDEDTVRNLVLRFLQEKGYDVVTARDGQEALRVCEETHKPIHLLITDVIMPNMSGSELAERLLSIHPNCKVLFMSGYTNNVIVHHGVLDPDTKFIQKPFPIEHLIIKIRQILD